MTSSSRNLSVLRNNLDTASGAEFLMVAVVSGHAVQRGSPHPTGCLRTTICRPDHHAIILHAHDIPRVVGTFNGPHRLSARLS